MDDFPLAQDEIALARIEANAPIVPYPLINRDRRNAPVFVLIVYLFRLIAWRWRSRGWRG